MRTLDLSVDAWEPEPARLAAPGGVLGSDAHRDRLARQVIDEVRRGRPEIPVAYYGLYGSAMADTADRAFAGETDDALLAWVDGRRP